MQSTERRLDRETAMSFEYCYAVYIYIYIYKRACLAANDKAQVCLLQCQFLCEKSSLCQPY